MKVLGIGLALGLVLGGCIRRAPTHHELARRSGEPVPPPPPEWTTDKEPKAADVQLRARPGVAPEAPIMPSNGVKVWLPAQTLPDGSVLWGWVILPIEAPALAEAPVEAAPPPVVTPVPKAKKRGKR